jgi:pseudouridine-5'-monophosphatase
LESQSQIDGQACTRCESILSQAARILVQETGIPISPEEYLKERDEMHAALFPHCKPLPGVVKLVNHLHAHGIPIAVATSSHKDAYELKTCNNQDLFRLFGSNVICGDDARVKRGKPFPDIFLEAAKMLGQNRPEQCLVFEDSASGVMAGLAADMKVVWIPDANNSSGEDLKPKCARVLSSMLEFEPESFGLPAYT